MFFLAIGGLLCPEAVTMKGTPTLREELRPTEAGLSVPSLRQVGGEAIPNVNSHQGHRQLMAESRAFTRFCHQVDTRFYLT